MSEVFIFLLCIKCGIRKKNKTITMQSFHSTFRTYHRNTASNTQFLLLSEVMASVLGKAVGFSRTSKSVRKIEYQRQGCFVCCCTLTTAGHVCAITICV